MYGLEGTGNPDYPGYALLIIFTDDGHLTVIRHDAIRGEHSLHFVPV